MTEYQKLLESESFQEAKQAMLVAIEAASRELSGVRPATSPELSRELQKSIEEYSQARGRGLVYPFMSSGFGRGPWVELVDGSVKYDMITGIGIHFFGHSHPELMSAMVEGIAADVMQGNLQPGPEAKKIYVELLKQVGKDCRLKHGWLTCSGTMANEVALKIIRQKKAPATRIFAFEHCFAGRSTAMQEITDSPKYREGQPVYGEVTYLPFFDAAKGVDQSVEAALKIVRSETDRYPGRYAALMMELVQGEGGFNFAPRDYYIRIFEETKKRGLAIWVDEIQTFGRTGELFAYQYFGLNQYVDVVTVGKLLQACMVLFAEEYNPKPGLVSGTFSGGTMILKAAVKVIELLTNGDMMGADGKIARLSQRFRQNFDHMADGSCKGFLGERRILGGLIAFTPFMGTADETKAFVNRLYDAGVITFMCGHGPYLVRMLPPMGSMNEADVDSVCSIIERTLIEMSKEK